MREIRFRAWCLSESEMYYDCQNAYIGAINKTHKLEYRHAISFGEALKCDNFILMQYTGLKDKNGKEVFEGDIVRHNSEAIKGEVFFWEGAFVVGEAVSGHALVHFNVPNFVEIIGNIYDNPELLKS